MLQDSSRVLSVEPHERAVLAKVACRDLEHDSTQRLQAELMSAIEAAPALPLLLDLSGVEYMPSLALGLMVKVHKSLAQAGRKCVLFGLRPQVRETMSVSAIDRLLVLRGTLEEALQAV